MTLLDNSDSNFEIRTYPSDLILMVTYINLPIYSNIEDDHLQSPFKYKKESQIKNSNSKELLFDCHLKLKTIRLPMGCRAHVIYESWLSWAHQIVMDHLRDGLFRGLEPITTEIQ